MEFNELILARRSVRSYCRAPSHEELEAILRDAQQAPSWKNGQPARCYAVESPGMLAALHEKALPDFNSNSSKGASLVVTTFVKGLSGFSGDEPSNEAGDAWGAYDLGLHDAYLVLAAKNAGFDTLIMGIRDAKAIRDLLGIPENEQILSVIAVGRSEKTSGPRVHKALEEVVKFC